MVLPPHDPDYLLGPQLALLLPASCFEAMSRLDPAIAAAGPAQPAPLGRIAAVSFGALRVRAAQLKEAAESESAKVQWLLDGEFATEMAVVTAFAVADARAQAEAQRISRFIMARHFPDGIAGSGRFSGYSSCMVSDAILVQGAAPGWLIRTPPHSTLVSGWSVYQHDENLDLLVDRDGEWPLEIDQLLHLAPGLESLLLYAPIGSELRLHPDFGQWIFERPELGDWELPDGDLPDEVEQLIRAGQVLPGLVLPQMFGGRLDQANVVYLPPMAWRAKQEFEGDLESQMASGLTTRYSVQAVGGVHPLLPERLQLRAECGGAQLSQDVVTRHYRRWGEI